MDHGVRQQSADISWHCWFFPHVFMNQAARHLHMSVNHPNRNRIIPPLGFVELHLRPAAVQSRRAAATVFLTGAHAAAGADCRAAPAAGSDLCVTRQPPDNTDGGHAVLGGFGSFHAPVEGFVHGTLPVRRPSTLFQMSTAARIRAYYEAMPEASRTRRLVAPSVGQTPSRFNTPLLREVLNFALSAGGAGLSTADQRSYVSLLLLAEAGGAAPPPPGTRHSVDSGRKRSRPRTSAGDKSGVSPGVRHLPVVVPDDDNGAEDERGNLANAFPTKTAFVAAVREEQRRVLSKLRWDETPLDVGGVTYLFNSRDLLFVVLDLLHNARHVQLWG